jgi:hypothetical protein
MRGLPLALLVSVALWSSILVALEATMEFSMVDAVRARLTTLR